MKKPDYSDVISFIGKYVGDNMNINYNPLTKQKRELLSQVEQDVDGAIEQMGKLRLKKDLGGDDLDMIELVMEIEEEFEVQIDDGWLGGKGDDPTLDELAQFVVLAK